MSTQDKEGWYEDPAGRHEFRWFSGGVPTDLVRDQDGTGNDPISMRDPKLFEQMNLGQPADTAPLLHQQGTKEPHFELLNVGTGPGGVFNTNADSPSRSILSPAAGAIEVFLVLLPLPAALILMINGAPLAWVLACFGLMLLLAVLGYWRRGWVSRRLERSAAAAGRVHYRADQHDD